MLTPTTTDDGTYPGYDCSLPQLLYAAQKKLEDIMPKSGITATVHPTEIDFLEMEAFEVLRLTRSVKNSFAPINRIPLDVLVTIPDYDSRYYGTDKHSIWLTHVCHDWREAFTCNPLLWTKFNFMNIDKTCTYIKRSKSCPLNFDLGNPGASYKAFSQIGPGINRVKFLTISQYTLPELLSHFHDEELPLEELFVEVSEGSGPALDTRLFNGDLTSLRKLFLRGNITKFPWRNLANLQTVELINCTSCYELTVLLDFLESAPLLHTVVFNGRIHGNLTGRRVHLDHLRCLKVSTPRPDRSHSTLFHHLHIPIGASLTSSFYFHREFPLLDYLQRSSPNFSNLSPVTAVNLLLHIREKKVRLSGPNGSLCLETTWETGAKPHVIDSQVLYSLDHPMLSPICRLALSYCGWQSSSKVKESPAFKMLSSKENLRALTLIHCNSQPFILALDPEQVPSDPVLCPNLEKLDLYLLYTSQLNVESLIKMVKARASQGMKPLSIMIVISTRTELEEDVVKLREHITHLEYRVDQKYPQWDDVPREDDSESK